MPIRRVHRGRRAVALLAVAVVLAATPLADGVQPAAAGGSRAVVVVGGSARVISFGGSVTGLQALRMVAGVETVGFGGIGEAVCSINGVGNPATPNECLIGPNGEYWAYYRADSGATGWQYSSRGAGGTTVTDGSVEGWRYGTGGPPGFVSFCAVAGCGPPPTVAPPPPPPVTPAADPGVTSSTAAGSSKKAGKSDGEKSDGGKSDDAGGDGRSDGSASGDSDDRRGVEVGGEQASAGRDADGGGGDDGGSPVGVIVAVTIALGVVGGGLWYRRRRIRMDA